MVSLFEAQNHSMAISFNPTIKMVMLTNFRSFFCCYCISSSSMERHSFGKLREVTRKIRDTARSRRKASSSISPSTSGMRQDCHDWNENHGFFQYTAGRFLFDELVHIAASSIASKSCVAVRKLPEGQDSKAFLLTIGSEVPACAKLVPGLRQPTQA